jgi:integrase
MRITTASARALTLPAGQSDKTYFDDALPTFGVRVRATGSKSYVLQYKVGGKNRRLVLGAVGEIDHGKARATAKDLIAKIRLGGDPASERHEARLLASETFAAWMPRFLARQRSRLKPRTLVEVERHLLIQSKALHGRPLVGIDRRTIAGLLSTVAESSGPGAANRLRASLSAFFTWVAREGVVDANVVSFTNRHTEGGARERVLSDIELAAIWRAADDGQYGAIVRLLILLGLRREEIGGLLWSEVDLERGIISLPPARTKNRRAFEVPLSAAALEILKALPRDRDFVFGRGDSGFQGWSKSKARLDARLTGAVASWVLHDVRRTLSTIMHERLSIMPHVVEAVLGHVSGHKAGVAGRYNRAEYLDERRRALTRWADFVAALAGDTTGERVVVSLHGA